MIDLDALIALRAVDRHGSVVAAAEALGYTPSAISQQVKRLERQAGLPLLERVGRGVMLTQPGRQLVDHGAAVLTELERIEAELHHSARSVAGTLRLAAFSSAMRGLVAPLLPAVLAAHPQVQVLLTEREPWDTVELVASGQLELGIVHRWGDVPLHVPEHLEATVIAHDVADVLLPSTHRLAGRRRVSPRDLRDEQWIATPDGTICRQWLRRMYDGTGTPPRIAHQCMEFESHLALVAAGLGIALVPRLGRAALPAGVVAVAVHDPEPTREVMVLYRRSMAQSPAVHAVVAALGGQPGPATPRRAARAAAR
jgi:DNA-binding transcriptional LysR family regulator